MKHLIAAVSIAVLAACSPPPAETPTPANDVAEPAPAEISVTMTRDAESGAGEAAGTVLIRDSAQGATFELNLNGLPAGAHGFHVHQTGDCSASMVDGVMTPHGAAGGHWDPQTTGVHAGPDGNGHLGDLPRLDVGADGRLAQTVTAPRIDNIEQLRGRALMIHAGGDNYADTPAPSGGGGARIACGVIG